MNNSKLAIKKGANYAEILKTKISSTTIDINNKTVKELSQGELNLYSVRLLCKGSWGIAYSYKPEFPKLIAKAIKNARTLKQSIKIKNFEPVRQLIAAEYVDDPREIDIADKKAMLLSLDRRRNYKKISSLNLIYNDKLIEHTFENSEGSSITINDSRIGLLSVAYAKQGNRTEQFFEMLRKRAGYEHMAEAQKTVNESMNKAEMMLKAKHAKGGISKAIVDQYLGGVFAHEAVGHACEADLVQNGGSIFAGKIGKKIGNDNITIYDDGNIKEWGYAPVDSEGIKASHTILINKGILENYLHSRETAATYHKSPTGNGRSQDSSMRVIPRMTNTAINKGDSSFEEMLQSIKKGYYLKGSKGGQVDTAGGDFLFNAKEGYLIENGKIKHMIKDVSLLGSILETLNNIHLIAKDTKYDTG
ncbi:MAG: TldD/PmbA family protein, partial [archaeon]